MGILSLFRPHKDREPPPEGMPVDLSAFRIGATALGEPPDPTDFFSAALERNDIYEAKSWGVEIGAKNGVLDYIFLAVDKFNGTFTLNGEAIELGVAESDVMERFGTPYWIDRSDGEVILFYEYQSGKVELQFEFPDAKRLGCVTISRDGVLSEREQRKAYGVDKSWPPADREQP